MAETLDSLVVYFVLSAVSEKKEPFPELLQATREESEVQCQCPLQVGYPGTQLTPQHKPETAGVLILCTCTKHLTRGLIKLGVWKVPLTGLQIFNDLSSSP